MISQKNMLSNLIKRRVLVLISLCVFRVCLDFMYLEFIIPYYEYSGFDLSNNLFNYNTSWVLLLLYSFFVSAEVKKPTDYFFMIAATSVVIPITSLYGLANREIAPVLTTIFCFIIMFYIVRIKLPISINSTNFKNGKVLANRLSWIFIFILIGWYFVSGAVVYFNINFKKVYDFRVLSADLVNVGVMSYITSWVYNVFSLYALAYALLKRNYWIVLTLILIQTFFYGVSAHKSVFFSPFLVIGVWWYLRRFTTLLVIPLSFSFILVTVYFISIITDDIFLSSMFIRRVFFVPAELTFRYFSFFSDNQFVYWSNSILSYFIEYPYNVNVALLIGGYGGSEETAANNGLVSTGYAHFGYFGILIYTIFFSFILKLVNYVAEKNIPIWFVLALTITPLRTAIISSDLPTNLLTHGLIIAIILLIII